MTHFFATLFAALFFCTGGDAAETPETILIRQTLGTDLSGHRRGDADLVLANYEENFVAYDARGSTDPRAWTIELEGRESFAGQLKNDLQKNRYDTERTIPSIQVRADVATATTIDSGQIVDRQSGAARTVYEKRFWTLFKREERWRATAVVIGLGDEAPAAKKTGGNNGEISAVLEREEQGREGGDAAAISALFTEHFRGYDGRSSLNPATWKIIFSGTEELEKHLAKRLPHVTYRIDRQILQTQVGAQGNEAVAITREKVSTQHARGDVQHEIDRYVMWTLSKRDGSWKITNMLYNFGQPD